MIEKNQEKNIINLVDNDNINIMSGPKIKAIADIEIRESRIDTINQNNFKEKMEYKVNIIYNIKIN
jgi:hypothetical protein